MEETKTGIKCDCGNEFIFDRDGVFCKCGVRMPMKEFEKYKKQISE
jgi:hypothetical protein